MSELLKSLLVSGSLGALVGLERQWHEQSLHPGEGEIAGARTFCLWGLFGTLCAHFATLLDPWIFGAGLVALALGMAAHALSHKDVEGGGGLTTSAGAGMVYLIGGLAYMREWEFSVMLTVVVLLLLRAKSQSHALSRHFRKEDVGMALQFLAVSGVILPLVPDKTYGPYGAFNPHSVWLMVVIVSGLGFAGYVAIRALGTSYGIALTGLAGGLASSTATTLSMSRMSKDRPDAVTDCALAIVLACTVMLWRVNALVFAVSPALARELVPDMLAMSLPGTIFAGWHFLRNKTSSPRSESIRNPLSLRVAVQFAALYALVVFVAKAASAHFGPTGLFVASFFSGLTDLDAIALTLANMFQGSPVEASFAASCVVLAAVANSLTKLGLAWGLGHPALRPKVTLLLGATILIGGTLIAWRMR